MPPKGARGNVRGNKRPDLELRSREQDYEARRSTEASAPQRHHLLNQRVSRVWVRQARRKAARRTVRERGRRGGAISVTRDPPNDAVARRLPRS